jgi:twitching motility protein PilU
MEIAPYLKLMVEKDASDLFFSAGTPVHIKIEGEIHTIGDSPVAPGATRQLAYSIMNDDQRKAFERNLEMNLAIALEKVGRFRVNIFQQRGEVAMVVRYVRTRIPTLAELNLPARLEKVVMEKVGLVLLVGGTGTGKSTTLAAMIDYRNENSDGHILTIEEPIEYVHKHKRSVVDQREIGIDTLSYDNALKNAMREAPDVILIGEIRDRDTMQQAIAYAETGHLCLSTLHANNAYQALERIIHFFPEEDHAQLFMDLSLNLKAVIAQRLLRGVDGVRLPAVEILLQSPYLSELIQKGEIDKIRGVLEHSTDVGMQTLDQSLFDLYKAGRISLEEALHNAESHNNLSLRIRLSEGAHIEEIGDLSLHGGPQRQR